MLVLGHLKKKAKFQNFKINLKISGVLFESK